MIHVRLSIPFIIASIIFTMIVPYLLGRRVSIIRICIRSEALPSSLPSFCLFNSTTSLVDVPVTIDDKHQPSWTCQSLGIDIDMIDPKFLQSSMQMKDMIMKIVTNDTFFVPSSSTPTTPTCYSSPTLSTPATVNRLQCEVSFSNTHLYVHAWPQSGAMSMDIFSCNDNESLLLLLPTIQQLVGVTPYHKRQENHTINRSKVRWEYKLRGDRTVPRQSIFTDGDIGHFLYGWIDFDLKELVVSVETEYQDVYIYDIINPRFQSFVKYDNSYSQGSDGSYCLSNPEICRPDRVLYLDGIMQSRLFGDAAYHEALVHPALFTHPNPRRVAIIGGGEGATLREVLKHNTIDTVTMIEIDEELVTVSRQYLPEWSDCSMIVNSTRSCFDDPRSEIFYTDAIAWFIDRYRNIDLVDASQLFDVIIMDALDPESSTDFSNVLYDDDDFITSISNSLRPDGIIVSQLGENVAYDTAGAYSSSKLMIENEFMNNLISHGFDRIEDYSESHGGFLGNWQYKIIFKCSSCMYYRWHNNPALIDFEIKKRSMASVNDQSLFRYFDGATMMGYQYSSRVNEIVFCRDGSYHQGENEELCQNGYSFGPVLNDLPLQNKLIRFHEIMNMQSINDGGDAYYGLISSNPIKNHTLAMFDLQFLTQSIIVMPTAAQLMKDVSKESILDINLIHHRNVWDTILNNYSSRCDYWGTSCYNVKLYGLILDPHLNRMGNGSIVDIVQNITLSMPSVVYNPYISRNYLNHQLFVDKVVLSLLTAPTSMQQIFDGNVGN